MGFGKPQRLVKYEVAGSIYYGNIRKLFYKIWDKPKWGNPLLFWETDFTTGFTKPMFPVWCATVVELRLQQMGDFYENRILQCKVGVENFFTKLPKGTPLRQIWWWWQWWWWWCWLWYVSSWWCESITANNISNDGWSRLWWLCVDWWQSTCRATQSTYIHTSVAILAVSIKMWFVVHKLNRVWLAGKVS